jgi:hypothetical protein
MRMQVASVFGRALSDVPNFIEAPGGYLAALQAWIQPFGLSFLKLRLDTSGHLPFALQPPELGRPLCLLAGKSPRGDHKHVVVGRVRADGVGIEAVHDPIGSDGGGLDGPGEWAGFFVQVAPARMVRH